MRATNLTAESLTNPLGLGVACPHLAWVDEDGISQSACQVVCEGPVPAGRARAVTAVNVLADVALLAVFVLSCMSVVSSSYNPFIYFQF